MPITYTIDVPTALITTRCFGKVTLAEVQEHFRELARVWPPVDRLDVLLALVEAYESRRWPIDDDQRFDPIEVLNYAIDELGHTQAELAELFGSRSRASEILSRRRALTVEMIHKISEAWKIPADLLVRPYRLKRAA